LVLLDYSINFNGILIMEDINPLNVLGKRVVPTLPLHFTKISIPCTSWRVTDRIKELKFWVYTTLEGRFWLGENENDYSFTGDNSITIGFEDSAEATYFSLAYPQEEQEDRF
jgi:hypothetical protein